MDEIKKTIKKIPVHVKRWNLFALFTPPIFLSAGVFLILSDIVDFGLLFWIGAGLFSLTAFFWWIWILRIVFQLSKYLWTTNEELEQALAELTEIKKDINRSNANDQRV
jgi:hypothetical protein